MLGGLGRRATHLRERMDAPDCDLRALQRTYAQFQTVNALVSGWRRVYARELRPLLSATEPRTLLDIGCGGGDVPRGLARWAAQDGLRLEITAVDADARAIAYARGLPQLPNIAFRQAMSGDLVAEGRRFDFVISNHLLHHLDAAELAALLADSERLCRVKAIHGDIERSPLAYLAFAAGTKVVFPGPFFPGSFIREDGLLSIRRSYTHAELRAVTPPGWQARRQFPYRNLLLYQARG